MITLITPPDIFENENVSFVLMNISDQEQETASKWLGDQKIEKPINLYYYQGETDLGWLFHAIAISKGVYLNCDNNSDVTKWITSYVLGKSNTWYKTSDDGLKSLLTYINQRSVDNIETFLEVHLGK